MEIEKLAEIIDANARMAFNHTLSAVTTRSQKQFERMKEIEIGDLVTETSSAFAYPAIHRVGYLENRFKGDDGWEHFIIRKLDGKTMDWSNCSFIKVFEEYVFDN